MATNVTVFAVDGKAVIYLDNGDVVSVEAESEYSFQLPEGSFCTVSDAPEDEDGEEDDEHPPAGYRFAQAMVLFWQGLLKRIRAETPTATPV